MSPLRKRRALSFLLTCENEERLINVEQTGRKIPRFVRLQTGGHEDFNMIRAGIPNYRTAANQQSIPVIIKIIGERK